MLASFYFFFNDTATTEIYTLSYTLSLHDALPIYPDPPFAGKTQFAPGHLPEGDGRRARWRDRKSTRPELQSHSEISYAVFCLKKKKHDKGIEKRSAHLAQGVQPPLIGQAGWICHISHAWVFFF